MLDLKDKKILLELLNNSRTSSSQLAKKVGLSREVTIYRIEKLKKTIIRHFYTLLNLEKLGFERYSCFLQLKGISPKEENEFMKYLMEHKFITFIGSNVGKWNIILDIIVKDQKHLKELLEQIKNQAGKFFESSIVYASLELNYYPNKLIGLKNTKIKISKIYKERKLDKIDKEILYLLTTDSRIEYAELSQKMSMSANAIKYRLKAMEDAGIIEGYSVSLNFDLLGEIYVAQFKFDSIDEIKLSEYLRKHEKVIFEDRCLGNENWDAGIGFLCKDSKEFRKQILELKQIFGSNLKLHDIYITSEIYKDNIAPEGIFI